MSTAYMSSQGEGICLSETSSSSVEFVLFAQVRVATRDHDGFIPSSLSRRIAFLGCTSFIRINRLIGEALKLSCPVRLFHFAAWSARFSFRLFSSFDVDRPQIILYHDFHICASFYSLSGVGQRSSTPSKARNWSSGLCVIRSHSNNRQID